MVSGAFTTYVVWQHSNVCVEQEEQCRCNAILWSVRVMFIHRPLSGESGTISLEDSVSVAI